MCVYPFITLVSCFVYFWCAGSVGIFLAGRVIYFLCVCDSAVWSAGPVRIYSGTSWSGWRDCTGFSVLWFCCSGYGTVEMVRGVVCLSFVSSVCCQFSWRLDVRGRISALFNSIFFGRFVVFSRGFIFCKLLIFFNLLQVVKAE